MEYRIKWSNTEREGIGGAGVEGESPSDGPHWSTLGTEGMG